MNRAIERGDAATGREVSSRPEGRFHTDVERQHLRDMFSQYSDDELVVIIAELEQIIRQRGS